MDLKTYPIPHAGLLETSHAPGKLASTLNRGLQAEALPAYPMPTMQAPATGQWALAPWHAPVPAQASPFSPAASEPIFPGYILSFPPPPTLTSNGGGEKKKQT